ncbi:hypothetical protein P692DRAFT_20472617 [Suillus brevipes Sb2]|nr:hypothetical protein P692DRAFT_20472617 [Suillus brevipes Sb2]
MVLEYHQKRNSTVRTCTPCWFSATQTPVLSLTYYSNPISRLGDAHLYTHHAHLNKADLCYHDTVSAESFRRTLSKR